MDNQDKDIKRIQEKIITFKHVFDKKNDDLVYLEITINDAMKDILKEISLEEKTTVQDSYIFQSTQLKRHKVKSAVFASIGECRDLLFIDTLLSDKKILLPFSRLQHCEHVEQRLRSNFIELCQIVKNLKVTHRLTIVEDGRLN